MMYIPSFIRFGSAFQKLIERDLHTHRMCDLINLFFFTKNKEISFKVSAFLHAFAEQQPLVCLTKPEGGTIDHGTLLLVFQGVQVHSAADFLTPLDVAHPGT